MFKFIKRIFTKNNKEMFSNQQLSTIQDKLNGIKEDLKKQSSQTNNKTVKESYKALDSTLEQAIRNTKNIKDVQDDAEDEDNSKVKKFGV